MLFCVRVIVYFEGGMFRLDGLIGPFGGSLF